MRVQVLAMLLGTVHAMAIGGAGAQAQSVAPGAEATLPPVERAFPEPFSQLGFGQLRELADGRVIVADIRDRSLRLVDFERESATALSGN